MEEDLRCWETDLLTISGKGTLDLNLNHGWRLEGYRQGKSGDRFARRLILNRRMHVPYLDVFRCGIFGEYRHIW